MHRRHFIALATAPAAATSTAATESVERSNRIVIGQTADFSGPQAGPVKEATAAVRAVLAQVNSRGGINGRAVVLESLDDGFDPQRSLANARTLVATHKAVALFLTRGTANAEALAPWVNAEKVPLIAPVATSRNLHEPPTRYVFLLRPQARHEASLVVRQLASMGLSRIGVVYTEDAFGKDAAEGAIAGLKEIGLTPQPMLGTPRGKPQVEAAAKAVAQAQPQVVMALCPAETAAALMHAMRAAGSTSQLASLSTTSSESYVKALGPHARGVMVAQVYPSPFSGATEASRDFEALARSASLARSYSAMEGFIAARMLLEGLRRAGADTGREALVQAMESMSDLNLGGFHVQYGPGRRSASRFVELTVIGANGRFVR